LDAALATKAAPISAKTRNQQGLTSAQIGQNRVQKGVGMLRHRHVDFSGDWFGCLEWIQSLRRIGRFRILRRM